MATVGRAIAVDSMDSESFKFSEISIPTYIERDDFVAIMPDGAL